jgi:predicted GNAT superfamily acetyltransferase
VNEPVEIARAEAGDLDGMLSLQAENRADRGGALSGSIPRERLSGLMAAMPIIVARRGGRVVGFLVTSAPSAEMGIPIVGAMLAAYPGAAGAYVYGPIVVAAAERGKGLAQAMFAQLRSLLPGREGILFIRRDNLASLRAHAKMGMREVASFTQGGADFTVFAYIG